MSDSATQIAKMLRTITGLGWATRHRVPRSWGQEDDSFWERHPGMEALS